MSGTLISAPFLRTQDGVDLYRCTGGCGRPMQRDRRRNGAALLPGIPRHGGKNMCEGCARRAVRGMTGPVVVVTLPSSDGETLTGALGADLAWADGASCAGAPRPDAFNLPDDYRGRGPTHEAIVAARRYCTRCPVLAECHEFAETHTSRHTPMTGLWGGRWRTTASVVPITTKATA